MSTSQQREGESSPVRRKGVAILAREETFSRSSERVGHRRRMCKVKKYLEA